MRYQFVVSECQPRLERDGNQERCYSLELLLKGNSLRILITWKSMCFIAPRHFAISRPCSYPSSALCKQVREMILDPLPEHPKNVDHVRNIRKLLTPSFTLVHLSVADQTDKSIPQASTRQ